MFGKLMKYELRYLIRIFAPMWATVLALCVMTRLSIGPKLSEDTWYIEGNEAILPAIIGVITVFAIMTMMIVAMVVLLQRFYKGMYGDEGYLMFTLPVTTGGLINAKGLSAMLMLICTELVTFLGVMIMVAYRDLWFGNEGLGYTIPQIWNAFLDMTGMETLDLLLMGFWSIVTFLIVTAEGIYMIYLAISLGQLWKKHPVAGAIVAYYAINAAIGMVEALIGMDTELTLMQYNVFYQDAAMFLLLYSSVRGVILLAASFLGTKLMLDKKLNIA